MADPEAKCIVPPNNTACAYCIVNNVQCVFRHDDDRKKPTSKAYVQSLLDRVALLEQTSRDRGHPVPEVNARPRSTNRDLALVHSDSGSNSSPNRASLNDAHSHAPRMPGEITCDVIQAFETYYNAMSYVDINQTLQNSTKKHDESSEILELCVVAMGSHLLDRVKHHPTNSTLILDEVKARLELIGAEHNRLELVRACFIIADLDLAFGRIESSLRYCNAAIDKLHHIVQCTSASDKAEDDEWQLTRDLFMSYRLPDLFNESGFSLQRLYTILSNIKDDPLLQEPATFADLKLGIKDDDHEYRIAVANGAVCSVDVDVSAIFHPVDVQIVASNNTWSQYLSETSPPEYADMMGMLTEGRLSLIGNTTKFFQYMTLITNMMRALGHRKKLTVANGADNKESYAANGTIESITCRYVHLHLDGHDYRIFYEETGPKDGIPLVLLHAANTDARMWRHQLTGPELAGKYRLIAFDMPRRGRLAPPPELLRTEYRLSNDLYRRTIRAFCDALDLDKPILDAIVALSPLLVATSSRAAGSWNPFSVALPSRSTAWLYESGSPRTLCGDLGFASLDCDSRPFMGKIDTGKYPFYVLGGEYDWSCTEEHTDAIKQRMPGAQVVRMKGIGHFPPDENPAVFKKYLVPCLEELIEKTK
ncbi:Alpha/Beta hydrolase protein [Lophiotrema nucula]|uniref:Alpha/Beta hydrolase protein n=1 Tax=Lophiotrema nucula TaxID=690887 RepID=A0A6A5YRU7_9PLEO|nr:Alpha/Beta hydrolase protein [Lophiotrema nucula]